jgi:hypothetical protein
MRLSLGYTLEEMSSVIRVNRKSVALKILHDWEKGKAPIPHRYFQAILAGIDVAMKRSPTTEQAKRAAKYITSYLTEDHPREEIVDRRMTLFDPPNALQAMEVEKAHEEGKRYRELCKRRVG